MVKEKPNILIIKVFLLIVLPISLKLLFDLDILLVLDLELVMILISVCLRDVYSNVFFLGFIISLAIFLLSGDIAEELFGIYYWIRFDDDANLHSHICIMISLIFLYFGYKVKRKKSKIVFFKSSSDEDFIYNLRNTSKLFFYVSFPILFIETIYKVIFVVANGYLSYYVSYSSLLPSFLSKIQDLAPIALCVFLATMPSKAEAKRPMILYFIYMAISILTGQRGTLVYNLVFIIGYLVYRNHRYNNGEVWISKRTIFLLVLCVPFLFVFLFIYGYVRADSEIVYNSFLDTFLRFFVNIGSSSKVIKAGFVHADEIPKWRFYSFGDILNYFKYSRLFHPFSSQTINVHSAEYALNSHSFDALISYLTMKTSFLNGQGAGSSFIAVLYADFGYIGIAVGSFIYGMIFKSITYLDLEDGWLKNSIKLYMLLFIMRAPRGSYDGFIAPVVNLFFVACILLIYFAANSINRRRPFSKG